MSSSYGQTSSTLWGPTLLKQSHASTDAIEVSVHTLPRPLHREFRHVFDERNLRLDGIDNRNSGSGNNNACAEFLAIPTCQQAKEDLVSVGDKVEQEKDRLLNVFMDFARGLCEKIRESGYWADFIDPCSGLPWLTLNCNKVYSEVDGMECCLGYKSYNAGFCKILTHPKWGSAVYPATIFVYAPRSLVLQVLRGYPDAILLQQD